jgi:protein-disulfide isomerase
MVQKKSTLAGLLALVGCAFAQPPIPSSPSAVGFELGNAAADKKIEIYGDYQCPDTKATWDKLVLPLIKNEKCAGKFCLVYHPFPLPYHRSGFDSAQAALVMQENGVSPEIASSILFKNQAEFQTTEPQVLLR